MALYSISIVLFILISKEQIIKPSWVFDSNSSSIILRALSPPYNTGSYLLDSSRSGNLIWFLSSTVPIFTDIYFQAENLLHLTIFDSNYQFSANLNFFISLPEEKTPIIKFYGAKILSIEEKSLLINYCIFYVVNYTEGNDVLMILYLDYLGTVTSKALIEFPKYSTSNSHYYILEGLKKDNITKYYFFLLAINQYLPQLKTSWSLMRCINQIPILYSSCSFQNLIFTDQFLDGSKTNFKILLSIPNSESLIIGLPNEYLYQVNALPMTLQYILLSDPDNKKHISECSYKCDDFVCYCYNHRTKFLLLDTINNFIYNIGLECNWIYQNCWTNSISIVLNNILSYDPFIINVSTYFTKYFSLMPTNMSLTDAIFSSYDRNIIFLINSGDASSNSVGILTINLNNYSVINYYSIIPIKNLLYQSYCYRIFEWNQNLILLYCVSNQQYISEMYLSNPTELFYSVILNSDGSSYINYYYQDIFSLNYLKVISSSEDYQTDIIGLSSDKGFSYGTYSSKLGRNIIKISEIDSSMQINSFTIFSTEIFIGGCFIDQIQNQNTAILIKLDSYYHYIEDYTFSEDSNSCIQYVIETNTSEMILGINTKVDDKFSNVTIQLVSIIDLSIFKIDYFLINHTEVPMLKNNNQEILVAASKFNNSLNKAFIELRKYDLRLNYINSIYLSDQIYGILPNTILVNKFSEVTVGGSILINSGYRFYVSHYGSRGIQKFRYPEGFPEGSALGASKIEDNVYIFVGYINKYSQTAGLYKYFNSFGFTYFVSDNGKFLKSYCYSGNASTIIYSSVYKMRGIAHLYGIQKGLILIQFIARAYLHCPDNYPIISELENGCLYECINSTAHIESMNCNPKLAGCNSQGMREENYVCNQNYKLEKIPNPENINDIQAILISYNIIRVTINASVSYSTSLISLNMIKNYKNFSTNKVKIIDLSNPFSQIDVLITSPSELVCINSLEIILSEMNIYSIRNKKKLNKSIVSVSNLDSIPCPTKKTSLSIQTLSITSLLIDKLSGAAVASSIICLNPIGIIFLLNCVNELSTMQLLNFGSNYPMSLNQFFNLTTMLSFNFLNNPLSHYINITNFSSNSLYDNNIGFHTALQGTSFIYNINQTILLISIGIMLILLLSLLFKQGRIARWVRFNFKINFVLYLYQGSFYIMTLSTISALYYDTPTLDAFDFCSNLFAFISIIILPLISIALLYLIYLFRGKYSDPELEEIFGSLSEDMEPIQSSLILTILFYSKIQILIVIAIVFQPFPLIQISAFTIIYITFLILRIYFKPYINKSENVQSIMREALFLTLILGFDIYYILIKLNSDLIEIMKDILLYIILLIFVAELVFSFYNFTFMIIEICREKKLDSSLLVMKILNKNVKQEKNMQKILRDPNLENESRILLSNKPITNTFNIKDDNKIRRMNSIQSKKKKFRANLLFKINPLIKKYIEEQNQNKKNLKNDGLQTSLKHKALELSLQISPSQESPRRTSLTIQDVVKQIQEQKLHFNHNQDFKGENVGIFIDLPRLDFNFSPPPSLDYFRQFEKLRKPGDIENFKFIQLNSQLEEIYNPKDLNLPNMQKENNVTKNAKINSLATDPNIQSKHQDQSAESVKEFIRKKKLEIEKEEYENNNLEEIKKIESFNNQPSINFDRKIGSQEQHVFKDVDDEYYQKKIFELENSLTFTRHISTQMPKFDGSILPYGKEQIDADIGQRRQHAASFQTSPLIKGGQIIVSNNSYSNQGTNQFLNKNFKEQFRYQKNVNE